LKTRNILSQYHLFTRRDVKNYVRKNGLQETFPLDKFSQAKQAKLYTARQVILAQVTS